MIFIFYSLDHVLTYNAYFNFLLGERGVGKTFSTKRFVINKFLKKGNQFIYLRRYKTELSKAKKTYFSDILQYYPSTDFEVKGDTFFINKTPAGYALALSTANILKSVCYEDVTTIIFDEFIITNGCYHYLRDEVTSFLEFCETVFRLRDNVRVLFLANAVTQTNPYFLYFNISPQKNKEITLYNNGLVLLQVMKNEGYREVKRKSKFGQLINGTDYGNYAIENNFLLDNEVFIKPKYGNCTFVFAFIYKDQNFGVWANYEAGKMFVSSDVDRSSPYIFTTTIENHQPNTMLLKSARKFNCWNMLIKNFKLGNVYFESIKIKNIVLELFKLILL